MYLPIGVDRVEPWLLDGLNVQPLLGCILSGQPLDLTTFYAAAQVRALCTLHCQDGERLRCTMVQALPPLCWGAAAAAGACISPPH